MFSLIVKFSKPILDTEFESSFAMYDLAQRFSLLRFSFFENCSFLIIQKSFETIVNYLEIVYFLFLKNNLEQSE